MRAGCWAVGPKCEGGIDERVARTCRTRETVFEDVRDIETREK